MQIRDEIKKFLSLDRKYETTIFNGRSKIFKLSLEYILTHYTQKSFKISIHTKRRNPEIIIIVMQNIKIDITLPKTFLFYLKSIYSPYQEFEVITKVKQMVTNGY